MSKLIDIAGKRFGRLLVIRRTNDLWECRCDCGKIKFLPGGRVRTGNTSSCGCLRTEKRREKLLTHGMTNTPEYRSWASMIQRCSNPNGEKFRYYGGAGVRVFTRWLNSFEEFLKYVGKRPTSDHSLDRYPDPNGNYEPGNVRWATKSQQMRNRRTTKLYSAFGKTLCMKGWSEETGINLQTLSWRIHEAGQPIEVALRTP